MSHVTITSVVVLGTLVASLAITYPVEAQVRVNGQNNGEVVRGYANRSAYTRSNSPYVRVTRSDPYAKKSTAPMQAVREVAVVTAGELVPIWTMVNTTMVALPSHRHPYVQTAEHRPAESRNVPIARKPNANEYQRGYDSAMRELGYGGGRVVDVSRSRQVTRNSAMYDQRVQVRNASWALDRGYTRRYRANHGREYGFGYPYNRSNYGFGYILPSFGGYGYNNCGIYSSWRPYSYSYRCGIPSYGYGYRSGCSSRVSYGGRGGWYSGFNFSICF